MKLKDKKMIVINALTFKEVSKEDPNDMTFLEALRILEIEDYADRIFNSNSRGELFHLHDYYILAKAFKENNWNTNTFRKFFESVVEFANENWQRPASVYQHILKFYNEAVEYNSNKKE